MPEARPAGEGGHREASPRRRAGIYVLAMALVGGEVILRLALGPLLGPDVPFTLFALGIVVAAWLGGLGPGLVATVASLGATQILWQRLEPSVVPGTHGLRLAVLAAVGVAISTVGELRRRALVRAERADAEAARGAAELLRSDERFRRIVDTAQEGIWEIDSDTRTVYLNQRMADMLGYTPQEMLGKSSLDFVVGEDRPAGETLWKERQAGQGGVHELLYRHKDGRTIRLRSSATPLFDEGRFAGAFAMFTDVTDSWKSEEALRTSEARKSTQLEVTQVLAEATSLRDAVDRILATVGRGLDWHCGELWQVDVEANVLRCVGFWRGDAASVAEFEAAARQGTFSPGVGLPGRVWTSGEGAWITDLARDVNFPRAAAAQATGLVSAFAFPVTFAREVLGVICFFSRTPRASDPELLASFLGVGSQIGQFMRRKNVEEERTHLLESEQAARREAEQAARAKDEFLAVLSHELRTPLNAIVGWSHLLRTGQLDEEQARRAVEVIDRNAKAQAQIVADVLDVSRIVMGKVRLDVRPIDLSAVVEMALDSLRPAAEAKGIRLETAIAPDAPRVSGDVDRLQQVIWNLLSNGVKFTPAGGRILVQLARADGRAEIRVEDTGMGIDADLLPHVFERFRQGDSSSTRAHGGLGLGLALVRHLVEMHGGTVTAASPGRDRGAVFVVSLPISASGAPARVERPHTAVPEAAPELAEAPADGPPSPSTTVES